MKATELLKEMTLYEHKLLQREREISLREQRVERLDRHGDRSASAVRRRRSTGHRDRRPVEARDRDPAVAVPAVEARTDGSGPATAASEAAVTPTTPKATKMGIGRGPHARPGGRYARGSRGSGEGAPILGHRRSRSLEKALKDALADVTVAAAEGGESLRRLSGSGSRLSTDHCSSQLETADQAASGEAGERRATSLELATSVSTPNLALHVDPPGSRDPLSTETNV